MATLTKSKPGCSVLLPLRPPGYAPAEPSTLNINVPRVGQNKPPKWAKPSCQTHQGLVNIAGVTTVLNNLSIVDNTPKPGAAAVQPAGPSGPKVLTLAEGTNLSVRLTDEINTKTAKAGDSSHGTTFR